MREIKFRVWDKDSKKMYHVTDLDFKDKVVCTWNKPLNNEVQTVREVERSAYDVILMQYTSIANVYEGDYCIIRAEEPFFDENLSMDEDWELRGKIVFEDFAFWLKTNDGFHFWLGNDFDEIEVIGNIYENSELLEVAE